MERITSFCSHRRVVLNSVKLCFLEIFMRNRTKSSIVFLRYVLFHCLIYLNYMCVSVRVRLCVVCVCVCVLCARTCASGREREQ